MTVLNQNCRHCNKSFPIDDLDQAFYTRMGVPAPSLCPDDRQRRRLSFRNERNLYHRKCDSCEKQIISIYRAESPHRVYCNACWWSDKWSAQSYGQDFDFNRPFFDQMKELQLKVPRITLFQKNSENCEYTNHCENNKDCYLCVDAAGCQNVYYSKWMLSCQNCCDCYQLEDSQLCYEAQYQVGGYNTSYIYYSDHNTDSSFLYNCFYCTDCFMCNGLTHKQYCVYNKQLTKEEYEAFMAKVDLGSHTQLEQYKKAYEEMIRSGIKRAYILMCENCTGDCVYQSRNVFDSFDTINSQDSRYCYESGYLKDCYDVYESAFDCELQYECHGCNRGKSIRFGNVSYDVNDCSYIDVCHNSSYLFGCVGVQHGKYCILNKQYSKEDYEALVPKIIEHMKKTGEWGEFFPASYSPFAYNETIAPEYFPLTPAEASKLGYSWLNETQEYDYQGPFPAIPDNIKDSSEEVTKQILKCEVSGKLYKIIPQEFTFHRTQGLSLPRRAPQQRYLDRLKLRSPRKLWEHPCSQCKTLTKVPFENGENVYCGACYTKLTYA